MSSADILCPCNTSNPPGSSLVSATSSHHLRISSRASALRILRGSYTSSQITKSNRPPRNPESIPNADHVGSFWESGWSFACKTVNASARQISEESGLNMPKSSISVASASTAKPSRTSFNSALTGCARSSSARNLRAYHSARRCVEDPIIPRRARLRTVAHAGSTLAKKVDFPDPGGAFITTYSSNSVSIRDMIRSVASICQGCRIIPKYLSAKISILSYAACASGQRSSYSGTSGAASPPNFSRATV